MQNKKAIYIVLGIIVVALIAWAVYKQKEKNEYAQDNQQVSQNQNNSTSPEASSTPTGTGTTKKLSYGEAIKAYKYRFQFVNCHGNPGIISVKKGTPVMLDNRDKVAHTFKANGQSIRIAAEDYALLYPAKVTVGEVDTDASNLTCDGGGAAVLNVEK